MQFILEVIYFLLIVNSQFLQAYSVLRALREKVTIKATTYIEEKAMLETIL